MEFLRCDSCSKPLGEGAVGRGEATRRGKLVICKSCDESVGTPEKTESTSETSLTLQCSSCGCAISNIDLLEGRGFRLPTGTLCLKCLPGESSKKSSARLPAAPRKQAKSLPRRSSVSSSRLPQIDAETSQKRSPLATPAWLVMLVVLPAFGISLYTAITSQSERNELIEERNRIAERLQSELDKDNSPAPRSNEPLDQYEPPTEVKKPEPETQPETGLPEDLRQAIISYEIELARPLIKQLESEDITDRLDALGRIITQRAIGATKAVRTMTRSQHQAERQLAARALGVLEDRESITTLDDMARGDDSADVRAAARHALVMLNVPGIPLDVDLAGYTLNELRDLEVVLARDGESDKALGLIRKAIEERELTSER